MKIPQFVTVETEVQVSISWEDIAAIFAEQPVSDKQFLIWINDVAGVLKAVPASMIDELNAAQRLVISNFFRDQMVRFHTLKVLEMSPR